MAEMTARQKREQRAIDAYKKEEAANAGADAKRNAAEKKAAAAAKKKAAAAKKAAASAKKPAATPAKDTRSVYQKLKERSKDIDKAVNPKAPSTRKNGKK